MNDATCPNRSSSFPDLNSPETSAANWAGITSLALGVFGLVTAEFLPASLLTAMATDLGISVGAAGQAVTATALVGAIAALSIPVLTRNLDRKIVLLSLSLLLVLSNILAATASSFFRVDYCAGFIRRRSRWLLVDGRRIGNAFGAREFICARYVRDPDRRLGRDVCAAPLGAYIGELWGWRSAFIAAGCLSVLTLVTQLFAIPTLPPKDNPSLRILFQLLGRTHVQVALVAVTLVISGHFAGFTYIRPLLEDVTKLSVSAISAILLGYGIGGFFGNFAGGFIAKRSERNAIIFGGVLIIGIAITLLIAGSVASIAAISIALWGFAFGAFPIGFQTWIIRAAPDQAEGAGGLLVAAFQIAIASGAIGGGILVDYIGALGGPVFALVTIILGTLLVMRFGPSVNNPNGF